MKIAVDALGISQPGGGRTATLNLLTALFQVDHENQYVVFLDEPEAVLEAPNVMQRVLGSRGRFAARAWAQATLPFALRRDGVDLVHHIKNLGLFGNPGKTVVTVYDLSVLSQPEIYPLSDRVYWRWIEPLTLHQAHRIIAISQSTAQDISTYYGISTDKIDVVYPGYDPIFCPLPASDVAIIRKKYGLPDRFFLHVGSISRKKNLTPVVRAMDRIAHHDPTTSLVLAGRVYGKAFDRELFSLIEDRATADRVVMLGPVPPQDLPGLYNCATAVVYPSLQEGFGLVALEAMACGTPVITSGSGAIGEVVGEAAVIVGSTSDDAQWAMAMEQVLANSDHRTRLCRMGLARAHTFSNQASARRTLDVYHRAMRPD